LNVCIPKFGHDKAPKLKWHMIETHPFGNFIPENIKYLLLGSFTSNQLIKDITYDWFYGTKRNQFWPIISRVYDLTLETKESRVSLFSKLGIGIADIIYKCERRDGNSLDVNLINIIYNPELENILKNGHVKTIFFSSRYVENLYKKVFKKLISELPNIELVTLPSPSPRYAAMTKEKKIERYRELLPEL
jgi:TDG/mug DNA glycosylase family protein